MYLHAVLVEYVYNIGSFVLFIFKKSFNTPGYRGAEFIFIDPSLYTTKRTRLDSGRSIKLFSDGCDVF